MRYVLLFLLWSTAAFAQYPIPLTPTVPVFATANPGNPTGTASASAVMMGLGSSCTFTPKATGTVLFTVTGQVGNNTTADGYGIGIAEGTGGAPANGAASTGTQIGNALAAFTAVGNDAVPFSLSGIITGLVIGVPVWYDVRLSAVTAGTATASQITCYAIELH